MAVQNVFSADCRTAVVDTFAVYRVALGHTPTGASLQDLALSGRLRLRTPAVSFAVACSMRTCWDEECTRGHRDLTGAPIRDFAERGGVELVESTPEGMLSAGRLYATCVDKRIVGAEVLAACHAALLAESLGAPLLSAARASYCYAPLAGSRVNHRTQLI